MRRFTNSARNLFCIALTFFSFQIAYGDTLSSPFNLELSPQSTSTMIAGLGQIAVAAGSIQRDLPDQRLTTPYQVSIEGIHLNLNYAFNPPTHAASLFEWNVQSSSIGAELVVDTINASQFIIQQSGGATIRIRVDASCKDVHLSLAPGATQMNATVGFSLQNQRVVYSLKDLNASWTPSAWQITSMTCVGPQGFGELVRKDIGIQLQTINPFLPAIRAQIESQLATASQQPASWTFQPPGLNGISVSLRANSLSILPDGSVLLNGQADFHFSQLQNTGCQKTVSGNAAVPVSTDSLTIPADTIAGLAQCAYLNEFSNPANTAFTSVDFPAFQTLSKNYLLKLVLWPDLLKFSPFDVFGFQLLLDRPPVFGQAGFTDTGDLTFNLNTALTLSMTAPSFGGSVHYVDLSTVVDGPAYLGLSGGVVSLSGSTSVPIEANFDPEYLEHHPTATCIWTSLIGNYLSNFLSGTGYSFTLPVFQSGSFSLGVTDMTMNGNSADLHFQIQ